MVNHVFPGSIANGKNLTDLLVIHRLERVLSEDAEDGVGENT
jgi:hypothetical protein